MIRIAADFVSAIICVAAACSLANAQDASSIKLEPGLWKVVTKSSQDGKPLPDKAENRCYSAAEFDDLAATFATLFADHDCSRSHAFSGHTMTLAATCSAPAPQGGTLTVKGEGSYIFQDDKRFTGSVVSTFTLPNQPSTTFSVTKHAEYVGPCAN
jgi:outer membrane protein W